MYGGRGGALRPLFVRILLISIDQETKNSSQMVLEASLGPAREPTQLSPILAPQSEPYSWEYLRSMLFTLLDAVLYDSSRLNLILISRDLAISEGFSATLLSLSGYFSHRIHGTQPQDCYITAVCHEVAVTRLTSSRKLL